MIRIIQDIVMPICSIINFIVIIVIFIAACLYVNDFEVLN